MYPLIEEWLSSSVRQRDFCSMYQLPLAVFGYWLRKYRDDQQPVAEAEGAFVELKSEDLPFGLVLEYPNGVRLELESGASADYVRELAGQC